MFAYAGGDGHIYYKIRETLSKFGVVVIPFMYKGRGQRIGEGGYTSLNEIGCEAAEFVKKNIVLDEDYMLLGHSMGSIVAYECYQNLVKSKNKLPKNFFFSAQYPPDELHKENYNLENDHTLIYQLSKLGGVTPNLLYIPEFKKSFLPIIKSDLRLIKEYTFRMSKKIVVQTIILTGCHDEIKREKILGWTNHSIKTPIFIEIEGDHFFLFKNGINYDFLLNEIFRD